MTDPAALSVHDIARTVRLAEVLTQTVVLRFTLAMVVFLVDLVRRLRSRRREAESLLTPEPPRIPTWLRVVTQIASLAYFILLAYVLWRRGLPFVAMLLGQGGGSGLGSLLGEEIPDAPPLVTWTFGILALLAAVGALVLALWVALGDRLTEWWTGAPEEPAPEPLAEAVADSTGAFDTGPDPRRVYIRWCDGSRQ